MNTSYTVTRALDLVLPGTQAASLARRAGPRRRDACACRRGPTCRSSSAETSRRSSELLSVVVPVFNEAAYVRGVLDELLARQFVIPHEVIVVESNSTDGTREIVQSYEGRPGLRIIYEDRPRGKGAAVRRGLTAATGTIVLIQDADFEYDLDDYDALLEPILQRRTSFVLGSRSLGLDDWKVRRFARSRVKGFLMNVAQLRLRAHLQRSLPAAGDRRGHDVQGLPARVHRGRSSSSRSGFNFDIELACTIVKNGYSPMEVPVNYVARGFDEGKKVEFRARLLPVGPDVLQVSLPPSRLAASRKVTECHSGDAADDLHPCRRPRRAFRGAHGAHAQATARRGRGAVRVPSAAPAGGARRGAGCSLRRISRRDDREARRASAVRDLDRL